MRNPHVLAIMPAFNEERKIRATISSTKTKVSEICVVDDGSSDQTRKIALSENVTVISHPINQGKGMAIKTGIRYFLTTDHDIAIFIDADGQHDPEDIHKFIDYFVSHPDCDVVIASRFGTAQWIENMPMHRKVSNLLSRFGIWILYNGLIVEDPQNGFRAYSKKVLQYLRFKTLGYEAETEMIIDAYLKGFKIGTVHIESVYDDEGNSSKFSVLMDTWKIPGIMVRLFFKRKPFLLRTQQKKRKYRALFNPRS